MRRIYVFDNDPIAALITQQGLQVLLNDAARVQVARGDENWDERIREGIDLLIVDPNPRSREAQAVLNRLRTQQPELPVLVLTAYDTPRLRAQMKALGVQHYLAKPVDLRELEQMVRHAIK